MYHHTKGSHSPYGPGSDNREVMVEFDMYLKELTNISASDQLKGSCRLVGMVAPRSHVGYSTNPLYLWFLDPFFGNG